MLIDDEWVFDGFGLGWVEVGLLVFAVYGLPVCCLLPVHYVHVWGLWREGDRGNGCFFHFMIAWGSPGFALHSVAYCGQSSCTIRYDTIPVLTFMFFFCFFFIQLKSSTHQKKKTKYNDQT